MGQRQQRGDEQWVDWVTEGIKLANDPQTSFATDGDLYTFTTLQPAPPPDGSLRLTAVREAWLTVGVFGVLAAIGLLFVRAPAAMKLTALATLIILLVLIGIFLPTFALRVIDLRLFVAIELGPDLKRSLQAMIDGLSEFRGTVRWVTKEQMHVTLKFLGEVGREKVAAVCEACKKVASSCQPFEFRLDTSGCFPPEGRVRVIWGGSSDTCPELLACASGCEDAFEKLGFEQRCVLEDYFMLPDGQTEDVALLMMKLLERIGEF